MRTALAPVPLMAGLDVLVELLVQVEPLEQELERGGRRGGVAGAELAHRGLERARLRDLLHVLARGHRVGPRDVEAALERGPPPADPAPGQAPRAAVHPPPLDHPPRHPSPPPP